MEKEEYKQLTAEVMQAIKKAMAGDDDLKETFANGLELEFWALPMQNETILTLQGIYGFLRHCDDTRTPRTMFVNNALHDLRECVDHYTETWFAPRLSRFATYKPQNAELRYY